MSVNEIIKQVGRKTREQLVTDAVEAIRSLLVADRDGMKAPSLEEAIVLIAQLGVLIGRSGQRADGLLYTLLQRIAEEVAYPPAQGEPLGSHSTALAIIFFRSGSHRG